MKVPSSMRLNLVADLLLCALFFVYVLTSQQTVDYSKFNQLLQEINQTHADHSLRGLCGEGPALPLFQQQLGREECSRFNEAFSQVRSASGVHGNETHFVAADWDLPQEEPWLAKQQEQLEGLRRKLEQRELQYSEVQKQLQELQRASKQQESQSLKQQQELEDLRLQLQELRLSKQQEQLEAQLAAPSSVHAQPPPSWVSRVTCRSFFMFMILLAVGLFVVGTWSNSLEEALETLKRQGIDELLLQLEAIKFETTRWWSTATSEDVVPAPSSSSSSCGPASSIAQASPVDTLPKSGEKRPAASSSSSAGEPKAEQKQELAATEGGPAPSEPRAVGPDSSSRLEQLRSGGAALLSGGAAAAQVGWDAVAWAASQIPTRLPVSTAEVPTAEVPTREG